MIYFKYQEDCLELLKYKWFWSPKNKFVEFVYIDYRHVFSKKYG